MTTEIIIAPSPNLQSAPLFTPTPKAAKRVLEFFTGQINNDHTRRACMNATQRFAAWCAQKKISMSFRASSLPCRRFPQGYAGRGSPPTVKQHLAALRMLFDWLVTGHVIDVNPAHAVRGPKYVVKKGKTPVLTADEARTLLDSIPIIKTADENGVILESPDLMGLRDRALIGLMAYSFARVGAVLQMKVGDYFVQGDADGSACTKKAARSMTFPVTITSIISWTNISPRPESPATQMVIYSARRPEKPAF